MALRIVLLSLAAASFLYSDTITESGFLPNVTVGTGPQYVPLYIDSFDSNLGVLTSASLSITFDGTFTVEVTAFGGPVTLGTPIVPVQAEAILMPGFFQIGNNSIFGSGVSLQGVTPVALVPSSTSVTLGAVAPPQTIMAAVPQLGLADLESPFPDVPTPLSLYTQGVAYFPLGDTTIDGGSLLLGAPNITVTYTYTPLLSPPGSATAPEPLPTILLPIGLAALLIYSKRATLH